MSPISKIRQLLFDPIDRYVLCGGDKICYLRMRGVRIGEGCSIFTRPENFNLGTEPYLIEIGDCVTVASNVMFINHDGSSRLFRDKLPSSSKWGNRFGKIVVKDNCFIGMRATILPDVTIGPNSIVGACSLVNKDVPPNTVVAGVPMRVICTLDEYVEKYKQKMISIEAQDRESLRRELTQKIWGEAR